MAAKKRVPPPQPIRNRTWEQLSKAEQSAAYSAALLAYSRGSGPNPQTRGTFFRAQVATLRAAPATGSTALAAAGAENPG